MPSLLLLAFVPRLRPRVRLHVRGGAVLWRLLEATEAGFVYMLSRAIV